MIKNIKIKNFKSIKDMDLYFEKNINNIVGNNGVGKTNILESISLAFQSNFSNLSLKNLVRYKENGFYIEILFDNDFSKDNILTFSYDKNLNKKNITLNRKKITKKILEENLLKVCTFYPTDMNLFYLGPKYRREFLDNILKNTFYNYSDIIKEYEKILKNRNKILENILKEKSKKEEIIFWDNEFIKLACKIYDYRLNLVKYFQENINQNKDIFNLSDLNIKFIYKTKVNLEKIDLSIKNYLEKNLDRDIILCRTSIGPHIDDFDIIINDIELLNFASRGEIKSLIINLKLQEAKYIKNITKKTPIFLIDDLSSELDEKHIDILINNLNFSQVILTSIIPLKKQNKKLIEIK